MNPGYSNSVSQRCRSRVHLVRRIGRDEAVVFILAFDLKATNEQVHFCSTFQRPRLKLRARPQKNSQPHLRCKPSRATALARYLNCVATDRDHSTVSHKGSTNSSATTSKLLCVFQDGSNFEPKVDTDGLRCSIR